MKPKCIPPLCLLFIGVCCFKISAQEQLGLRLDNYAGVNALVLNPAAHATNPLTWDINIIGMGFWINNNLGYIENANVPKVLKNIENIGPNPSLKLVNKSSATLFYNTRTKTSYSISAGGRIMGPSIVVNLNNGHSFGLFTAARTLLTSHNLPNLVNSEDFHKINYNQSFKVDPFKLSGLAWSEIGVNYALKLNPDNDKGVTLGVNARYLMGFQGFFLTNYNGTVAAQLNKDTFRIEAIRATTGFTTNYNTQPLQQNGKGLGFDVGAVMITEGGDNKPYQWRFGISLLDLGRITMKKATEVHTFNSNEVFQLETMNLDSLNNSDDPRSAVLEKVNERIAAKTNVGNNFAMGLPSALQLQADYAFSNSLFINGLLIQRFRLSEVALERENLLAVTPRYESRWWGASMPISVTNMEQLRVGLNARLAFLTFGTEHLLSWIGNSKLSSTDFYFALKINPFRRGSVQDGGRRSRKKVNCYRF